MKTLVITPWDTPFLIVSWKAGIVMMLQGDATLVEPYEGEVCSSPSLTVPMPAVLRLGRVLPGIRRGVRFNRSNVFLRDRHTCQYCGEKKAARELQYEHVIPRARGGRTCWTNIVASCEPCNSKKKNRTPEEAGMRLLSTPRRPLTLPLQALELEASRIPREWRKYATTGEVLSAAM